MSKKIKWALLAMLGFATACSTVRNTARNENPAPELPDTVENVPQIRLMYGVRPPVSEEEARRLDSLRQVAARADAALPEQQTEER
ncbi:MAG: hypothetical protein ACLSVO_10990 [Alistipes sp.]|jgi:hypothetical protein|uniref:hypothetical protein n=1 Tax=Alistipes sp. TaxID=1872444 RepID=UPI001E0BD3AD|nr:hypothetical protein [Alistipes sp.]MBS6099222.1 hypothetical protein [Alistipes sp.]HJI18418.1 hypothetical protein [Rikenellaceae bacterium]